MAEDTPAAAAPDPATKTVKPSTAEATAARREGIMAIIRNGLSNSALSRDLVAWESLETRLPQIADAIIQEA